jgi:hypothetical protein
MKKPVRLERPQIEAIERTLTHGERVELIPVKEGVKVVRVRRDEIK